MSQCPRCHSAEIVKSGKHHCQKGVVQRYKCNKCGTSFSNDGYFRGKHQMNMVQYACSLYQNGLSLEKVQKALKDNLGETVSRTTLSQWLAMLKIPCRPRNSGNQKQKTSRTHVEVGFVTTIRLADSMHPEKLVMLQNDVLSLEQEKEPTQLEEQCCKCGKPTVEQIFPYSSGQEIAVCTCTECDWFDWIVPEVAVDDEEEFDKSEEWARGKASELRKSVLAVETVAVEAKQ
jgi:hypothetical protein